MVEARADEKRGVAMALEIIVFDLLQGEPHLQGEEETIMLSEWPTFKEEWNFKAEEEAVAHVKDLVKGIRNTRAEMDVPPSRKAKVVIVTEDKELEEIFASMNIKI